MKVNGTNASPQVERVSAAQPAREASKAAASRRADAGEQVQVSSASKRLASVRQPEVPDQKKIDEMRDRIAKGTLDINPQAIAGAMIREER
jgi:flagellar biosynthesis anti-sigma factor FlgM